MINVLIIGGGTQGLAFARALSKLNCRVFMLVEEKGSYADSSRYVFQRVSISAPLESELYLDYLVSLIRDKQIDAVIPMGDASARFISKNINVLSAVTGVKFPPIEAFMKGYDKNQLMALCLQKGYPHPATLDLNKVSVHDDSVRNFCYPAMLKPNQTTGGRGMIRVDSHEELLHHYDAMHQIYGDYHLQAFIPAGGRQFKVQLYVDELGELLQSTVMQKVRWFPPEAGSNCCAMSVEIPVLVKVCHMILKDIGWLGFADLDIIEDPRDGQLLVMEINPRVPACIKLPIMAGVNWAEVILNGYLSKPQAHYSYITGIVLRHLGLDTLWFLKSGARWKTQPSWFHFMGSRVFYQDMSDWTDPAPFIKGTLHNVKSLLNPKFREAKGLR